MDNNSKLKEQVKAEFTSYLTLHKHRKTPERYAILDHIYSIKGHFDMESLYNCMQKSNFRVSRATLYNTMELLLNCNLVVKHQFGANVAQYERAHGNENHDHFICQRCGKIKEYKNTNPSFSDSQKRHLQRFKVSYYSMYIYGTCAKCQNVIRVEEKKLNTQKNKTSQIKKK